MISSPTASGTELHTQVCVIGGGLVGSSATLHLAMHGVPVVLVERDRVGAHASGVNFGGVRRHGRDAAELPLAALSFDIWQRLRQLVGHDCEYVQSGHLKLALQDDDMAVLQAWHILGRAYGVPTELLGHKALRQRFGWVGRGAKGASWCPSDGQANPRLAAPAFARQACALGATVLEGMGVTHLHHDGRLFHIEAGAVRIRASAVINSAGAWGHLIAREFGDDIPLEQVAPQMYVTEPLPYRIHPAVGVVGGRIYLRQIARGNAIFGGKRGRILPGETRSRPVAQHVQETLRAAAEVAPMLGGATLIRTWTGIEGYPADGLPVIDESPHVRGLFHAFGFSGHGFQIAPGVGLALADWVRNGSAPAVLKPLGLARFQRQRDRADSDSDCSSITQPSAPP